MNDAERRAVRIALMKLVEATAENLRETAQEAYCAMTKPQPTVRRWVIVIRPAEPIPKE